MGGASSSEHGSSAAQQEEESLAASTGSLPALRAAFARLGPPGSPAVPLASLQEALSLEIAPNLVPESPPLPRRLAQLLLNVGPSIADLFFTPGGKEGIDWVGFLRGYNRCCSRMAASSSLNMLYRVYSRASERAGVETGLEFDSCEEDGKVGGSLSPSDLLMLLWMCYAMNWWWWRCKEGKGREGAGLVLPDVSHLVLSAFVSCGEVADNENVWNCDVLGLEKRVSMQKLHMWVMTTVPRLAHCFSQYMQGRIEVSGASETEVAIIYSSSESTSDACDSSLLTCGRAWALSLTLRNNLSEEFSGSCFLGTGSVDLLYRSSIHGKGLSRFWSNIEGYDGPLLTLVSANSADGGEDGSTARRWVIGTLTEQAFGNTDTFQGSSGYLYAISPVFRMLPPSGKDKNFVYCHLHPTVRVYEPHPKPVGLAFGGTIGNERIFIDEDFAKVTIRHHAVDKTYQPGSLMPNQGFLPVEASILDVEVWGFGGKVAKEHQNAYKKRETLFSEQRRKVDLKTFASWEDSPEKMMMDMVSDPNRVQREDR